MDKGGGPQTNFSIANGSEANVKARKNTPTPTISALLKNLPALLKGLPALLKGPRLDFVYKKLSGLDPQGI